MLYEVITDLHPVQHLRGDLPAGCDHARREHRITSYNVCYTKLLRDDLAQPGQAFRPLLEQRRELREQRLGDQQHARAAVVQHELVVRSGEQRVGGDRDP